MYKTSLIVAFSAIALVSAQIPSCAQTCITLPANCNGNPSCICTDQTWLSSLTCCVKANCDASDQQAALAYANTVCNPVSVTLASSAFATASCPSTTSGSGSATATGASATGSGASSAASVSSSASSQASSVAASASSAASSASSSAASAASSAASSASASATKNPADKLAANGMGVVAAILGAAAAL